MQPLAQIVNWSHKLLTEVLTPGDAAVDLTAGNGYDTLMLAAAVGPSGQVLAFDLQRQALLNTTVRLQQAGVVVTPLESPAPVLASGVGLVHGSHADLEVWSARSPRAVIANLGYLPGGDKALVTRPDSTLAALQGAGKILAPGGRIAVVVYSGHPGGRDEAEVVERFFANLDEARFEVLRLQVANRPKAPFLLVAGKLN